MVQADIRNNSKQIATGIKVNVREKESGKSLLPVYVSDGYFNLLPGEEKRIYMEIPQGKPTKHFIYRLMNGSDKDKNQCKK